MMKIFDDSEIYNDVQKLLRDGSGNDFDKFIHCLSVNTRNILDQLAEYEEIVQFVEEAIANEYGMKCFVFSLKNVVKVITKCIDLGCMNQRHVEQLNVIQNRVKT